MIEYKEETAICRKAHFVFTTNDSFGLYLEFSFDKTHFTSFYISSYAEVETIRKILNKGKTGFDEDSLDDNDLNGLIGKSAKILTSGLGTRCIFKGFTNEVIAK